MINSGDSTVHFTKLKSSQMAEVRSVLKKRPKMKFSFGLSPEAQEAMQQVQEDSKIQEAAKRGKRGSKGNVLFSDKVHVWQEAPSPFPGRRPSYADVFDPEGKGQRANTSEPGSPRRYHGRRRSSVSRWLHERPGSVTRTLSENDEVDQVLSANLAPAVSPSPD
ncbi:hypothetical protein PoB_000808700 [Plakobranchus ocellatus]|uniref:Uncharacterized protein n=1 Tax=Plakobranchus ocellatus TaxID=259542 RepID=A0AAV3YGM4_9GAST|nr:hypothetical protein PoB_000808700 [Plakobranchus ocellatus]